MSAKLRARKMPGVAVDVQPNPYPRMTVVRNPLGIGEPPVAGNGYRDYYPGGAYHDAYGNNYYNTTGTYAWHLTTALYKVSPSKAFMFPEWGLTIDDPGHVRSFATFVRQHRRGCASRASTTGARAVCTTCAESPGAWPRTGATSFL